MNDRLLARLKPEILEGRRNLLAAFALLSFINILSYSSLAPSLVTTFLNGRKSAEFVALSSIYSQYLGMTLPSLIPWSFVLLAGCCYTMVCRYGNRIPLLPAALLGLPLFFCFRLPVAVLMTVDRGRMFTSMPGLDRPLSQTGVLFTALGLTGGLLFLTALFTTPPHPRNRSKDTGKLDRAGYLIRCFALSLGTSLLSALTTVLSLRFGKIDEKGTALLSGILVLIMLFILIRWTVFRMRDAGLNPLFLLLILLLPEIPMGGVYLIYKSSSLICVSIGQMVVSLCNLVSAVLFFCIALWPGKPEGDVSGSSEASDHPPQVR